MPRCQEMATTWQSSARVPSARALVAQEHQVRLGLFSPALPRTPPMGSTSVPLWIEGLEGMREKRTLDNLSLEMLNNTSCECILSRSRISQAQLHHALSWVLQPRLVDSSEIASELHVGNVCGLQA